MNDEFYIGWEDRAPGGIAKRVRGVIAVLAAVVIAGVLLISLSQRRLEDGTFEFGVERDFAGVIYETPIPMLHVASADGSSATNYILVGAGKFGLPQFARGHDGQRVSFKGTLIQKGRAVMIEVNDEKSFSASGASSPSESRASNETVGDVELLGELVDTKCYFGVMRPATGKVHRACAVRCLSGGVPPGLLVRDANGNATVVMLSGSAGEKLAFDVQWAARVVSAKGVLELRDGVPVLKTSSLQLVD